MDKETLHEYHRILMSDTNIALLAAEQIEFYSQALVEDRYGFLWCFIHAFLVNVGNISKLLWGPPARTFDRKARKWVDPIFPERGRQLRESVLITEDSPLSVIRSKESRDYFEHFDERVDEFAKSEKRKIDDLNVWQSAPIKIDPDVTPFRNFDIDNFSIHYGSEVYHLYPVILALEELNDRVTKLWWNYYDGHQPPAITRKIWSIPDIASVP